ncbi:MAG TPA: hypothetical protein VMP01_17805 [Pirellulaceae bacterium]|nr:hypothetical protein [Pirellulaceae bacterium]
MNRGKLAVLSILVLAIGLAGFAWWYNYHKSQRPIEFWGRNGIARIRHAPQVELLRLRREAGTSSGLTISANSYAVSAQADISKTQGLKNGRDALVRDDSYDWKAVENDRSLSEYTHAVRFRDASGTTTVAFDFEREQLAYVESGAEKKGAAKIMAGWQTFAQRHLPANAKGTE